MVTVDLANTIIKSRTIIPVHDELGRGVEDIITQKSVV